MGKRVVIIGGGAAGLAAAITAARAGADVTIVEAKERVGKKILGTGNGRCNFSNLNAAPSAYNAPTFVAPTLDAWSGADIRDWFEDLGVLSVVDDEGRLWPRSNAANTVLDALRLECSRLGVRETCDFEVIDVLPRINPHESKPPFSLVAQSGTYVSADAVILASGSDLRLVPTLGHSRTKAHPVLCPLRTTVDRIRGLSGIRVHCAATLMDGASQVASEEGELLFRDYGVSGIMVFDLSRYAHAGQKLLIDFMPEMDEGAVRALIERRRERFPWREGAQLLEGILHPRLAAVLWKVARGEVSALPHLLKAFELDVLGPGDAKQAQVTRGGVQLDEVDPRTFMSKRVPGLYIVGETLDVDGRCGGYNLHWAWASGIIAGANAASGE